MSQWCMQRPEILPLHGMIDADVATAWWLWAEICIVYIGFVVLKPIYRNDCTSIAAAMCGIMYGREANKPSWIFVVLLK